ncbi:MAG: hypothetical protein HY827_05620 [Actinobacteria bacterium]|nr:hypothetical protein [Actinomycetota bacterium]
MHILEAAGVGAAAGLSPLVAIAAVVIFAAVHLGVNPKHGDIGFVEGVAMIAISAALLLQSLLMIVAPGGVKVRIAADRPGMKALHLPLAICAGGLAGAGVFNAEGHAALAGAFLGAIPAALVALAAGGLLGGVTGRLDAKRKAEASKAKEKDDGVSVKPDSTEGRIIAAGVDLVTIAAVAAALAVPPLALVLPVLAVLLLMGGKRREAKKHEGLRVLR